MAQSRATATAHCPGETEPRGPSPEPLAVRRQADLENPLCQQRPEQNRTDRERGRGARAWQGRRATLSLGHRVTPQAAALCAATSAEVRRGQRPLRAADPADVTGAEGQACPEPSYRACSLLAHHRPPRVSMECARVTAAVASASRWEPFLWAPLEFTRAHATCRGHGHCADPSSAQRPLWASALPTPLGQVPWKPIRPPGPWTWEAGHSLAGGGPSQVT